MIFYNKDLFAKAGLDPEKPACPPTTTSSPPPGRSSPAAPPAPRSTPRRRASSSSPGSYFYPLFAAETGGKQLVDNGQGAVQQPGGAEVAAFWKTLYDEGLAPKEAYNGDSFADQKAAMAIVGPWAISV
ncbi:hypothetical protein GCM10020218_074560 [Dactylosporangium vinaceum]